MPFEFMKYILTFLLAILLVVLSAFSSDVGDVTLDIKKSDPSQVLRIYKGISGLELIIDSRVKTLPASITLSSSVPLIKDESLKLIESALVKQAGILITRLDAKRASVTYNDALPINR
jgi:hypothetical protein